MKRYWVIVSAACLAGCLKNEGLQYDAVATNNMYHMTKIRKGMSEREVLYYMRQPYKYETYEIGEDVYDVWFYVTQTTVLAQSHMVPQNLTPLSFRNGVLAGTGYDYYYFIIREDAKQEAAQMPPKAPPQSPVPVREPVKTTPPKPEDTELEKSLQEAVKPTPTKPSQKPTSAPQKQKGTAPSRQTMPPPNSNAPPSTREGGDLQNTPQPTAPIFSLSSPQEPKKLTSLLGAKNPFSQVHKGMSETQVKNILGQPADSQTYQLGDDVYDILFYDTSGKENAPMTPLTFKNAVLVGMTNEYYEGIRQAAGDPHVKGYDKRGEEMQETEREQDFDYW